MRYFAWVLIGVLACSGCQEDKTNTSVDAEALFVHEVQPLLAAKCMGCHGQNADQVEGGLHLGNYENMLAGGYSGNPAIVPGNIRKSFLVHTIKRTDPKMAMPPKDGDKLTAVDIQIIEEWIANGAPWPDSAKTQAILAEGNWRYGNRMKVATSGGLSDHWDHRSYDVNHLWAYFPRQSYEIPKQPLGHLGNHPVDAFLQAKRDSLGLQPTKPVDKRTWIRRATFDLTGLPPSPQEIDQFIADESPQAYEHVINRLLDSPHYGEQWARHWLDVVRYADSGGFANDYIRPNAWRYRDYVVRTFNQDKPFDAFVREQIAGDEIDPNDSEMLVATGFLRMGPWEHTGMSVAAETRQLYLDDVTNIVGETFLATPLSCAKCHDHKYDPIPARDYYRVKAVFATTQFAARKADFMPQETLHLSPEEKTRIEAWINTTEKAQAEYVEKEESAAKAWFAKRGMKYLPKKERRKLPDDQQPPRYYGLTFEDLGYRKVLQKRRQTLRRIQDRFKPLAYAVYNGPSKISHSQNRLTIPDDISGPIPETYMLSGGSVYAPLEPVDPGVLSILTHLATPLDGAHDKNIQPDIPTTMGGRRLAFAKWLTDPNHPILARSMVNRVWQYHFGKGIVGSPNNFGATGDQPTHPELLDWLANYFVENNWSVKALHRLIMTSKAYQQSSLHPDRKDIDIIDPNNQWLCYFSPRRMDAEELRDAMLFHSGELNPAIGGHPVRPEINLEVALQPRHIMGSIAMAYQPSRTPEERNRRSIYAEKYRNLINPDMMVFDQPGRDLSCERREESTVTPQVFTLFNGQQTRKRALAMAKWLAEKYTASTLQVEHALHHIWCRPPMDDEVQSGLDYLAEMTRYHEEHTTSPEYFPTEIEREMFEEMTGQSFTYTEVLDIYQDYVPDVQPSQVDATTRALADYIAVLFNTNEFVYVY